MKSLVSILIALAPTLAFADHSIDEETRATWDCTNDPVVTINQGNGRYTFTGACKKITIIGGHGKITIDSVETLEVNGSWNSVAVTAVDSLSFLGSWNKVTFQKPVRAKRTAVSDLGTDNKINGRGGKAD